jgi:hypothetical protein
MNCPRCGSLSRSHFPAEVNVHFPGIKNLRRPPLWVFPQLLISRDCGHVEFDLSNKELKRLNEEWSEVPTDLTEK